MNVQHKMNAKKPQTKNSTLDLFSEELTSTAIFSNDHAYRYLLSRKTGKEIYWEHEEMMDDQEYARKAIQKIESYQMNDIYQADRLILTFETKQCVLNSKIIENLTARYLFEMI